MNMPIDTLAFAQSFEEAGFPNDQARALAAAFGRAQDGTREGLVTKEHLDVRLAEMEARLGKQIADGDAMLTKQIADVNATLTKQIADVNATLTKQIADINATLTKQIAEVNVTLTKQIAENGRDISGRLWSTVSIIAGVSTAISATIGAGIALLFKLGGL